VTAQRGLAPARFSIENGVVAIVKETRKTPIVSINIAVRAGSICDPEDAPGAVHLLARVIDRGTTTRSAAEIADEFEARGVSLSVNVTRHLLSFVCTCLADDFEAILTLVADIIRHPSFPEREVATRKGEVITAIRQDEDSPFVLAAEGLMAALYGPQHPYGRRLKGTVESVERISRDELLHLHAERVAPSEVTAVVVGDVNTPRVHDIVGRAFDGWRVPPPTVIPVPHPEHPTERRTIVVPMEGKSQSDIAYGFVTIARADPRYYAYWLMNHVLGQYAIGGRLGDSIRERQGMAYYVGSALEANIGEGPLFVRAGVNPANVDRAIASIDQELARIRSEGLTEKELDDSRRYLLGSMPRALETNNGIANFLQTSEFFGLGPDYDVRLPELLGAVTLEATNAAAVSAVDPARATIVIAGPSRENKGSGGFLPPT